MTDATKNRERRNCDRYPATLAVRLQPLSPDHHPTGEACDAISIDLSQSGVCCFCDRPFVANYALVRVQAASSEDEVALLAERVRCVRKGQFFEVALRFIGKLPAETDLDRALDATSAG